MTLLRYKKEVINITSLTYVEIQTMIDEYIEDPNSIDPKWVAALLILRQLPKKVQELESKNCALNNELCVRCGNYKSEHLGFCDGCRWKVQGNYYE